MGLVPWSLMSSYLWRRCRSITINQCNGGYGGHWSVLRTLKREWSIHPGWERARTRKGLPEVLTSYVGFESVSKNLGDERWRDAQHGKGTKVWINYLNGFCILNSSLPASEPYSNSLGFPQRPQRPLSVLPIVLCNPASFRKQPVSAWFLLPCSVFL